MPETTILLIFIGIVFISLIIFVALFLNYEKRNDQLNANLTNSVNEIKLSLNQELNNISDRMNSNIIQSHKESNAVFNSIQERMIKIDEAQKGLDSLSKEVFSLNSVLLDKKNRGTFGEIELYSLLELAYGNDANFYQKQYHLPNDSIVDAAIFSNDALGVLCIDSKFPLENYRRMLDINLDSLTRELAKKQFKEDIKKHLNDIKTKYIIPGVTADLAYMFIPAEAIYSELHTNFQDLVDLSYSYKVYFVSPTTLMAYITAIKSIYLGQQKDKKAKEIEALLSELAIEFDRLQDRNDTLYKDFNKLHNDFDNYNITANKLIKKFNKLNSGEISDEEV